MSNLTNHQQLILEFFVSEFTKINNTKDNSLKNSEVSAKPNRSRKQIKTTTITSKPQ